MFAEKKCPSCGNMMQEDSTCCPNCGAVAKEIATTFAQASWLGSMHSTSSSPSETGQPAAPLKKEPSSLRQASLTIIKGANKSREYILTSDRTRIGREQSVNEIALDDTQVSRCHAVITFENRQYTIEDLRSTNGTKVNGQTVTRHALTDGDVIQLGDTFLAFYL